MGAIKHLKLSEGQKAELEKGYKEGKSHAVRQRCHMMLLKSEKRSSSEVAEILGCCEVVVNSWMKRYEAEGIVGLQTRAGRGRKAILDGQQDFAQVKAAVQAFTHQSKQFAEREKARDAWSDTGAVFATETGNYTHPDRLQQALENVISWSDKSSFTKKRCKALPVEARPKLELIVRSGERLPDLKPHDLRHTAATLMLRRGVPVEVVSRILGHAKVSITLDVYRHVLESEKEQVMVDLFDTPLPVRQPQPRAIN